MDIKDAIHSAMNGNAILFLGTGFSRKAINILGQEIPGAEKTCELLIEKGKLDVSGDDDKDKKDLGYISELFYKEKGPEQLVKFVKEQFSCKEFTNAQSEILSLNWKRIYTTNYDDICEVASKDLGIIRESISPQTDPSSVIKKRNSIIHLNGDARSADSKNINSQVKLTYTSYNTRTIPDSDWAMLLGEDVASSEAIVFVGYSMGYDIELNQIMMAIESMKNKTFFVDYHPSNRTRMQLESFGKVFSEGSDDFARVITEEKKQFVPEEVEYSYKALSQALINHNHPSLQDRHVLKLLMMGKMEFDLICSPNRYNYICESGYTETIVDELLSDIQVVIIHSDLGNGKTILLQDLASSLCAHGKVFWLERLEGLQDDLDHLAEDEKEFYLLVDDYSNFIDTGLMKILSTSLSSKMRLVFSVRTHLNANLQDRLLSGLRIDPSLVSIHDINRMTEEGSNKLIDYLSKYGLWTQRSADSSLQKKRYITRTCDSQWRNVLMDLIESEEIQRRIGCSVKTLFAETTVKDFVILVLVSNILANRLSLHSTLSLLNIQCSPSIVNNGDIQEFIDIQNDCISLKSPILAEYLLKNYCENNEICDVILRILPVLDKMKGINCYKVMLRQIVSASNLHQVFCGKNNSRESIIKVYEKCKNLSYHKENAFFWLQYAIARMDMKEYEVANIYLNTAQAYSDKREDYNNWQIEVQRARYILESMVQKKVDVAEAFERFKQADNLLYFCRTKSKDYPLKQTGAYLKFAQTYFADMSPSQRMYVHERCKVMKERVDRYIQDNKLGKKNPLCIVSKELDRAIKMFFD